MIYEEDFDFRDMDEEISSDSDTSIEYKERNRVITFGSPLTPEVFDERLPSSAPISLGRRPEDKKRLNARLTGREEDDWASDDSIIDSLSTGESSDGSWSFSDREDESLTEDNKEREELYTRINQQLEDDYLEELDNLAMRRRMMRQMIQNTLNQKDERTLDELRQFDRSMSETRAEDMRRLMAIALRYRPQRDEEIQTESIQSEPTTSREEMLHLVSHDDSPPQQQRPHRTLNSQSPANSPPTTPPKHNNTNSNNSNKNNSKKNNSKKNNSNNNNSNNNNSNNNNNNSNNNKTNKRKRDEEEGQQGQQPEAKKVKTVHRPLSAMRRELKALTRGTNSGTDNESETDTDASDTEESGLVSLMQRTRKGVEEVRRSSRHMGRGVRLQVLRSFIYPL